MKKMQSRKGDYEIKVSNKKTKNIKPKWKLSDYEISDTRKTVSQNWSEICDGCSGLKQVLHVSKDQLAQKLQICSMSFNNIGK